ncbi:MAG: hypothetical protein Q3995_02595 [Eubacteriales bacterium]|nr:hypothetical protein [Eubacteriales bacterium]
MTIHRMRTISESVVEIKKLDAKSAVTENCVRMLCKGGKVHCVFTGKKILVDLDDLLRFISGETECSA